MTDPVAPPPPGDAADKQPLWMPAGSVRSIIALILVSAVVAAIFYELPAEAIAVLNGLAGTAVGYYFASRPGE